MDRCNSHFNEVLQALKSVSSRPLVPSESGKGGPSLPIRSNRISWKSTQSMTFSHNSLPYLLGQIGLVGNSG